MVFRRSSVVEQLTVNQLVVGSTPTVGANMLILNDNINLFGKNRTAHLPVAQCDLCDFFHCKFKQKRIISENNYLPTVPLS